MTHSLPYNWRFLYLTETLRLSQHNGQQGLPEWGVKIRDIDNFTLFCSNLFLPFRLLGFQVCLKPYQGQFWKHRSWLETIFIQKLKRFYPNFVKIPIFPFILIKYCQYLLFWLLTLGGPVAHYIDLTLEFLLGTEIAYVWEENESLVIRYYGI